MKKPTRVQSKRIQVWMVPTLYDRVREKARADSVNVSMLVRNFLRGWARDEAEDESPAPTER